MAKIEIDAHAGNNGSYCAVHLFLCGTLVSTLFYDVDVRLITGHRRSYDGVVLITGKMLELQPV